MSNKYTKVGGIVHNVPIRKYQPNTPCPKITGYDVKQTIDFDTNRIPKFLIYALLFTIYLLFYSFADCSYLNNYSDFLGICTIFELLACAWTGTRIRYEKV